MKCKTTITGQGAEICPNILAACNAVLRAGHEALFILDLAQSKIIHIDIFSRAILKALKNKDLYDMLSENRVIDMLSSDIWEVSDTPYALHLSMNICLCKESLFYVNLQVAPINLATDKVSVLLCTLKFAVKTHANILLWNRVKGLTWKYDTLKKKFYPCKEFSLSERSLEIIRLSRMGYTQSKIAKLLHCSINTIKWHKSQLKERLFINSIEEAISFCELHHLI